jgi:hypothetical protein
LYFFLSLLYVAYTSTGFFFRCLLRFVYDENLPIINKSKHPKMEGIQGKKRGRTQVQEDKRTTREHQVPKHLLSQEAYQVCLALAWLGLLSKNLRSRSKRLILS